MDNLRAAPAHLTHCYAQSNLSCNLAILDSYFPQEPASPAHPISLPALVQLTEQTAYQDSIYQLHL